MNEPYFGCGGCGQEGGSEGDYNYCIRCGSYKYFGWMKWDCTECGLAECRCEEIDGNKQS